MRIWSRPGWSSLLTLTLLATSACPSTDDTLDKAEKATRDKANELADKASDKARELSNEAVDASKEKANELGDKAAAKATELGNEAVDASKAKAGELADDALASLLAEEPASAAALLQACERAIGGDALAWSAVLPAV